MNLQDKSEVSTLGHGHSSVVIREELTKKWEELKELIVLLLGTLIHTQHTHCNIHIMNIYTYMYRVGIYIIMYSQFQMWF